MAWTGLRRQSKSWILNDPKQRQGHSDRALRAIRRNATRRATSAQAESVDGPPPSAGDAYYGYTLLDIKASAVLPDGSISYLVTYIAHANKTVDLWESARNISSTAIEKWKARRSGFQYSEEERQLMELCQGSLKERQKFNYCTTAGILVAILKVKKIDTFF